MRKPCIGITCGTFYDRDWCPPSLGHRKTYIDAVVAAGGSLHASSSTARLVVPIVLVMPGVLDGTTSPPRTVGPHDRAHPSQYQLNSLVGTDCQQSSQSGSGPTTNVQR